MSVGASPLPSPPRAAWGRWALFAVLVLACLAPWATPPMALAAGLAIGLAGLTPDVRRVTWATGRVLRASVVLLGFGVPLAEVLRQGAHGLVVTAATIAVTVAVGLWLGRRLGVADDASMLVTSGTAICGGSAIAAVAPAIDARAEATGVALAVVFVLNGAALFLFPPLGHALGLSPEAFGALSALAIHDTSSVVGAAQAYDAASVATATILKLTRALWIVPLVLVLGALRRRGAGATGAVAPGTAAKGASWRRAVPGFIALFVAASALRALLPTGEGAFDVLALAGRRGLVVALLLVGAGLTRATLRAVGLSLIHI